MADHLICLSNIAFSYPNGKLVFENLNFCFQNDDRAGLVGSNGSGKTTLLQLVMGLIKPQKGTVEIFGKIRQTEKEFREARMRIGFVFQDANDQLFCPTVGDDVAFGPLNMGKTQQEVDLIVDETLSRLKLESFKNRVTYGLSDGEKKLVAIATALAMQPQMLILDEPTTCLDEAACDRIAHTLLNCGLPYLVVTHDRDFLDRVTTHRITIHPGGVVD